MDWAALIISICAFFAAALAALYTRGQAIESKRANQDNERARSARLEVGMQAAIDVRADGTEYFAEHVSVFNPGPSAARQVMVTLEIGDQISGQGMPILEPGQWHLAKWDGDEKDIRRLTLSWHDGRGTPQTRTWNPGSPSWPLKPRIFRDQTLRPQAEHE